MARVWFVFDGLQQRGEPFAELRVGECADKLKLERSCRQPFLDGETPTIRGLGDRLRDPKRVVVEVFEGEDSTWPAGFYEAPISPDGARIALLD